MIIMLNRTNIL